MNLSLIELTDYTDLYQLYCEIDSSYMAAHISSSDDFEHYCRSLAMPLAVVYNGIIVGMTSFRHINPPEATIGFTWIAPQYTGNGIASASKALMFQRARDLQLKTLKFNVDPENVRSIRSLTKAGCVLSERISQHTVRNGVLRDTLIYTYNLETSDVFKQS